ncbi:hypothetical protein FRB90_002134 [Tulasnella sp. 427]|nr:hypothetical protein FRB90_002134 [Tulasnella sp. 427]
MDIHKQWQGSDPPARKPSPPDSPPKSATSSKFNPADRPVSQTSSKRIVLTVPPWAKHEQPVPDEESFLSPIAAYANGNANGHLRSTSSHERMPSDIASFTSSQPDHHQSPSGNWWTFTVPRRKPVIAEEGRDGSVTPTSTSGDHDPEKAPRRRIHKPRPGIKQTGRNRSSWIFGYALNTVGSSKGKEKRPEDTLPEENQDETSSSSSSEVDPEAQDDEDEHDEDEEEAEEAHDDFDQSAGPSSVPERQKKRLRQGLSHRVSSSILRLELPLPPAPFTKAQTETPGWDSPWNPRKWLAEPEQAHHPDRQPTAEFNEDLSRPALNTYPSRTSTLTGRAGSKRKRTWKRRRRRFRAWCLHNLYVPLLFRMINLAFTSATLGIAIQTRRTEKVHQAMGILGSSSTVTIIFAPLTLVHVIVAIYLEYFGRPVGLWQTSAKVAHTLLEVVFICAWSASLALCFNDFFTTPLECGPASADRWWSDLPPLPNQNADDLKGTEAGRTLCREQLALICLAFVTLASYCSNLVISLFRIIEKVKNYSRRNTYWN